MTTIAYSHKLEQVAIDSRLSDGGLIVDNNADKTLTNETGTWLFCGKVADWPLLASLHHNQEVEIVPDAKALVIRKGVVYLCTVGKNGLVAICQMKHDYTLGGGRDFAMAAMDFGKTPSEAVKYAMTRDMYTGGKVRCYKVETG